MRREAVFSLARKHFVAEATASDFRLQEILVFRETLSAGEKLHNSVIDRLSLLFHFPATHITVPRLCTQCRYRAVEQSERELPSEIVENCNETGGEGYVCAITKYNFYCYCAVCTLQV